MLRLEWLENQMGYCDLMAEWIYEEFVYEFKDQPLANWQQEYSDGQRNGQWKCLIATEKGQLLGGASLATRDLDDRPDIGPWLACVFVCPSERRKGLAAQLIEGICGHAREAGVTVLYLHTHSQADYYARLGWQIRETFQAWGKDNFLMSRDL